MSTRLLLLCCIVLLFSCTEATQAPPWESKDECRGVRATWDPNDYYKDKPGRGENGLKGFSRNQMPIPFRKCGDLRRRSFIPFGQNNEDVKIWKRFFFNDDEATSSGRFFVEMGGLDGIVFSNTFILEHCLGWKGMLIEADPTNYRSLIVNRPCTHNIWAAACMPGQNSHIFMTGNAGMASQVGLSDPSGSISGSTPGAGDSLKQTMVPCRSMASLFSEYNVTTIDFFSLDVEGAEAEVLKTIDFEKVRVNVIIVEINKLKDDFHNTTDATSILKNYEVDSILQGRANMVKLASDGKLVPRCQQILKRLRPGELTLPGSSLYVHRSLRDDMCPA